MTCLFTYVTGVEANMSCDSGGGSALFTTYNMEQLCVKEGNECY